MELNSGKPCYQLCSFKCRSSIFYRYNSNTVPCKKTVACVPRLPQWTMTSPWEIWKVAMNQKTEFMLFEAWVTLLFARLGIRKFDLVMCGNRGEIGRKTELYGFNLNTTCCLCSSTCRLCWSYSSRAHCWYINDINGVSSQVWKYGTIRRGIYIHRTDVTPWISWEVRDIIADGFSSKIFIWQSTPFYNQTGGVGRLCDDGVRSSEWNWKRNNCVRKSSPLTLLSVNKILRTCSCFSLEERKPRTCIKRGCKRG